MLLGEDVQVGVFGQISRHADDVGAQVGQFSQGVTKRCRTCGLTFGGQRGDHRRSGQSRFGRGVNFRFGCCYFFDSLMLVHASLPT